MKALPKVDELFDENFHVSTEYSSTTPPVQNSLEIAPSLTVSEIFAIFNFLQKFKMAAKNVKIENFHVSTEYSSTTLWVQYSLEITLSLTVSEIFAIFHFPQKFKMAAKSCKI